MPAYARLAAAIALAASTAAFAMPAVAADLYEPPYDEYGEGPPPPDDFEPPYPPAYADGRCIPREEARDRLRAAGCRGFHDVEPHDRVVLVKARRPSGRMFELTIDRCSGEVVDARPLYRRWGRFAGGPRRHWDRRPYY